VVVGGVVDGGVADGVAVAGTCDTGVALPGAGGTAADGVESWAKTGETKMRATMKIATNLGEKIRIKAF